VTVNNNKTVPQNYFLTCFISLNNFARGVNTKRLTAKTSYYCNRRSYRKIITLRLQCNVTRGIAKAFLSVCQSDKRVLCKEIISLKKIKGNLKAKMLFAGWYLTGGERVLVTGFRDRPHMELIQTSLGGTHLIPPHWNMVGYGVQVWISFDSNHSLTFYALFLFI